LILTFFMISPNYEGVHSWELARTRRSTEDTINLLLTHYPLRTELNTKVASLESKIASVKASIESTQATLAQTIQNLENSVSGRMCQVGVVGCEKNCGGYEGKGYIEKKFRQTVIFERAFKTKPKVYLALQEIHMAAFANRVDWYGWKMVAENVTTTSFEAALSMFDRAIFTLHATYIACAM